MLANSATAPKWQLFGCISARIWLMCNLQVAYKRGPRGDWTMNATTTDRIEKQILLRAPRSRVWRALTDSREFGTWFRTAFTEPFRPGARVKGRITYPGYEHLEAEILVVSMEPERMFSFRWHPNAVEPHRDDSNE